MFIPTAAIFLNRPELIAQIKSKFKNHKCIQTIAIIGPGGVGKTTIAHQYAHQQNAHVTWRIDAETQDGIRASFEKLALAIATIEDDKRVLSEILAIKDYVEKEIRIIHFVKEHLKSYKDWFLVFDNVEKFADIQKYFPQDASTWGVGKIILTTRDNNMQNNEHVEDVILIGELSLSQKLELFTKIMNHGNATKRYPDKDAEKFLESIPPFPLDISAAAYYLKATNVSYTTYLQSLKVYSNEFEGVQSEILKEAGKYTKTRYGIVTMALENIIHKNKDFADLVLLISLIDSQNIPKDLLDQYKNEFTTNNFIFHLKKHSLVTHESSSLQTNLTFAIHRNTQEIILIYFKKILNLTNKNNNTLKKIADILDEYMSPLLEEENVEKIRTLIPHYERFLSHENVFNDNTFITLRATLACMFYYAETSDTKETQTILEKYSKYFAQRDHRLDKNHLRNLIYLGLMYIHAEPEKIRILADTISVMHKKTLDQNTSKAAWALCYLGRMHYIAGNYIQAKDLLEKSYTIYQEYFPKAYSNKARVMAFLGNIYWGIGDYKNSKKFLEESYVIHNKKLLGKHYEMSWCLQAFSYINQQIGNYQYAEKLLKESLTLYKKNFPDNKVRLNWPSIRLADILVDLGNYQEAIRIIEESLADYKKYLTAHHHEIGWALLYLGRAYMKIDDYKKAKLLLDQALEIFEENFGKEHLRIVYVLEILGELNLLEDKTKEAEEYIRKALRIYANNPHPKMYRSLELLSDIYLKHALHCSKQKNFSKEQQFKKQGLKYLRHALDILQKDFPQPSSFEENLKKKFEAYSGV